MNQELTQELTQEERKMIMNAVNAMIKEVGMTRAELIIRTHHMAVRNYVEDREIKNNRFNPLYRKIA